MSPLEGGRDLSEGAACGDNRFAEVKDEPEGLNSRQQLTQLLPNGIAPDEAA